ncbi:MAG: EAL domain-containing protein [Magnetococcales bacterium]|nr:EAL domain-containing protein [Magnetococcales bacterium]
MNKNDHRPTILIVDDSPGNIHLMGKLLSQDYQVLFATNGQDALTMAASALPDLVLLDVMMPEIDGFTVCNLLRNDERTRHIPVIIVTAMNDSDSETRGFTSGAVDFLTKPINPSSMRARVAVHLELKKQREELKAANAQLQEDSEFDILTGLPNRKLFQDRLKQAILAGERNNSIFSLLFIDLDRFKWVNDTLGHDAGDALLIEVAQRMKSVVRKSDTVARLGGDEFTVILSDILHESMAELVGRKILEQLSAPFQLQGQDVVISGSVGIAVFPGDGTSTTELAKNADIAMYQAKESGRNSLRFFSQELNRIAQRRMLLEADMRRACLKNEFFLEYQPKINSTSGKIIGMEALIRWEHPRDGILYPHKFIPIAEENGLIIEISAWVLHTSCRDAVSWADDGFPNLKLAVNLSAIQFREGDKLFDLVESALRETGFPAHHLELEITETMMLANTKHVSATLQKLRSMGVSIAMDDFGTGYSSLALLRSLPIQVIKIDGSFIKDLVSNSEDVDFVAAILLMAKKLGLHVVVEGVETAVQMDILKSHGGDDIQGYYFCPPLCGKAFHALLHGKIPLGGRN